MLLTKLIQFPHLPFSISSLSRARSRPFPIVFAASRVFCRTQTWDNDKGGGDSEWLNGILRDGYRCFGKDVDDMVRAALTTAFAGIKLPVVSLALESFSIGDEAPYFNELRLLPTRR
jgi:hypothetical protein